MSFSNISSYVTTPPSTKIKEDFLMSFVELEVFESNLQSCKNGDQALTYIASDLVNITKVYNENVKYINHETKSHQFFEFPSFEEYSNGKYARTACELRNEYDHDKSVSEFKYMEKASEVGQLKQLSFLCNPLTEKITRVFDKLNTFESIASQIPSYQLLQPNQLPLQLFAPQLRIIEDAPITTPSQTITASQEIAVTPVQTTISSPFSIEINEPTPILPSTVDVTLVCDLNSDQTLGICCDPSWADAPIAFTKNENGWSGQVPVGKDWKCVVLQNNQVLKWENANNHRCDAQTQPLLLNVKFS